MHTVLGPCASWFTSAALQSTLGLGGAWMDIAHPWLRSTRTPADDILKVRRPPRPATNGNCVYVNETPGSPRLFLVHGPRYQFNLAWNRGGHQLIGVLVLVHSVPQAVAHLSVAVCPCVTATGSVLCPAHGAALSARDPVVISGRVRGLTVSCRARLTNAPDLTSSTRRR
ncbi:hypothetical protein C8Q77DRAFT_1131791 [Trametes polyzona]|nr:hypothetical protein C8Q77DRAFT_1131791 [Trametes polyzona]